MAVSPIPLLIADILCAIVSDTDSVLRVETVFMLNMSMSTNQYTLLGNRLRSDIILSVNIRSHHHDVAYDVYFGIAYERRYVPA